MAGAAIPGILIALLTWALNRRTNRALAKYQSELGLNVENTKLWRAKRVEALIDFYDAVRSHLQFMRECFYFPSAGRDVTPLHDFRRDVERIVLFFDGAIANEASQIVAELHEFWNWAQLKRTEDPNAIVASRHPLDFELPENLDRVRRMANTSLESP